MCAVSQFVLTVASHLGVLIVEEMIFECCAELGRELIACSDGEQSGHVVARAYAILIGSRIAAELCMQSTQLRLCALRICCYQCGDGGVAESGFEDIGVVLGVQLRTELVAGTERKRTLMEVETDDGCEAPALLVDIEQQSCQFAQLRMVFGDHVTTIVSVIVVGPYADCSREAVEELVGEVELSAVDVLLSLHL